MALSSLQLEAFFTVAQTLNFTKAANLLHITQSALSQRIINLETELETALFIRDRAGLRLTERADELVRYCVSKNSLEEEFLSKTKGSELSGLVRIGGFSSVMPSVILPSLAHLFTANPTLKLQMIVDELDQLPARLRRGEIDFMISTDFDRKENMERIVLGSEQNVLVQKKHYSGPDIYLDHDENDRVTMNYLRKSGHRKKPVDRRYLDNIYGLIEGVRLGLGRAVLPKHLLRSEKDLEIVNPDLVYEIPVSLYFYTQPYYTKLHGKVVDSLTKNAANFFS